MSDISELQSRIANALDRIGSGLDYLGQAAPEVQEDTAEVMALRAQLDEERTANAQLEDRVRSIREKQDSTVETLAGEVERLTRLLATQEETVARLARVNAELRSNNTALREAISDGVAEPHLVNKSMMAELDALRAAQSADRAELDSVLGELDAMIDAAETGGA
ncbi:MAG: hypothetical protein VX874_18125 [Pseudomonadota bacterium]|nr:hypothetical protein [Pseudomonadota bacterium]